MGIEAVAYKVPNGLRMDWSGLDSPVIVKSGPRL